MIEAADADQTRQALAREIAEARSTLGALRVEIAEAGARRHDTESWRLREANEQLVLAMVKAQTDADAAARALEAASRSAGHDALTGLPNRSLFRDRFAQAAARARRQQQRMALLFIDLDHFKPVNDRFGHAAGDALLVGLAARLLHSVRGADTLCRFGGDEFVLLVPEVSGADDAGLIAHKLLAAVAEPLAVGGEAIVLSASIGIALYPDDAQDESGLLACADAAMYVAKRQGGGARRFEAPGAAADPVQPAPRRSRPGPALAEQRRTNQVLREANERLVVAALGASQLQENAERALARHQAYLALLGHEIRTPLSPLRYVASLLERGPHAETALNRLKQTIERQVVQIARLVDDMLALSTATRLQLDVELQQADLVDLARQASDACRAGTDARQQTLTFRCDAPTQVARVDPVRIVQVITNLTDNASKYTPPGGQITVTVTGSETEVLIRVADTGMGISCADTHTLFEPFQRAPEALASGSAGLGIGLTVVREVVAAHGGTIEVRSEGSGRGSEFLVRLPR